MEVDDTLMCMETTGPVVDENGDTLSDAEDQQQQPEEDIEWLMFFQTKRLKDRLFLNDKLIGKYSWLDSWGNRCAYVCSSKDLFFEFVKDVHLICLENKILLQRLMYMPFAFPEHGLLMDFPEDIPANWEYVDPRYRPSSYKDYV